MIDADAFLKHYGKQGMKWGVRRAAKKVAKADKKWEKKANTLKTYVAVHNEAAKLANKLDVDRINNSPKYKGKDFTFDSPLRRKYYQEHEDAFNKRRQEAADKLVGLNPSGTKKIKIYSDGSAGFVDVKHSSIEVVEHASKDPKIVLVFDDLGHIVEFRIVEVLEQAVTVDTFISHYGKQGMKWGVRKGRSGSTPKSKKPTKPKASELSDKDLRDAVNRMNMERQYNSLINNKQRSKGAEFAKNIGTTAVKTALTAVATQQVTLALKKAKIAK